MHQNYLCKKVDLEVTRGHARSKINLFKIREIIFQNDIADVRFRLNSILRSQEVIRGQKLNQ